MAEDRLELLEFRNVCFGPEEYWAKKNGKKTRGTPVEVPAVLLATDP